MFKGMIYIDSSVLSARCLSPLLILSNLVGIQHLFCAAPISTYLSQAKKFKSPRRLGHNSVLVTTDGFGRI